MKKFAAIALALILAMSTMFATVATAADVNSSESSFAFKGFEINAKTGVVVDVENMRIYGLRPLLKIDELDEYLVPGTGYGVEYRDSNDVIIDAEDYNKTYIGTGTQIVLKDAQNNAYPFDVIIFGDVNGDSVYDVLDLAQVSKYAHDKAVPDELEVIAVDDNNDGEIVVEEYASFVNAVVSEEQTISQNNNGTFEDSKVVIDDQVLSGDEKHFVSVDDVSLTFNNGVVDSKHYAIYGDGSYEYEYDEVTDTYYGKVTVQGTGLFAGTAVIKFPVVSLLEKAVATVNEVIKDANLSEVVEAKYELVNGVADIKVEVDASDIIRGNFNVEMAGLNGLLTKIDEFQAKYLKEVDLTVGDLAIATDGDFDRAAIKALVFDIAKGIFCDIANADSNVVKSYSGSVATNNVLPEEAFNVDVVMTGTGRDIDRVKAFAAKVSRYVAFDVVDGNAVVDITMPAAFATKVVDVLSDGTGDIAAAKAEFDGYNVYKALSLLSLVTAEDISAGSVDEINQAVKVASMLVGIVNKGLGEVADATITDANNYTMALLNGSAFVIDKEADNQFGAIVAGVRDMLGYELLGSDIGAFANGDGYTAEFDVTLDYRNISEKVIVNLDLFGAAETPDIIEETATYFSGIITKLGLDNAVTVGYDAEKCRALATLDARELVTNFKFDDTAIDGLYTDIKGYFDDNYGTSTILVDGKEIVKAGKINKSALKDLIFSVATGFFQDAANLDANNVLRSLNTVVTEADGTEHKFDLDFALEGSDADIERIEKIADKIADYVSFEVVDGNAVVNVALPEGMRNLVINHFGEGKGLEAAKAKLNSCTINELFNVLAFMDAEAISKANTEEIEALVNMVCGLDTVVNKVLGKVSSATVTTVDGEAIELLDNEDIFDVEGNTIADLVSAIQEKLADELRGTPSYKFVNANGTYTGKFDIALSIGGIKETIVLNLDIFGDAEEKNAIEETVDYVDGILGDLGFADFASVEFSEGKAVATFDASDFLANEVKFDEKAFDGLYTKVKGYFDDNYGDSTITVGDYVLVTDGEINRAELKDFIFDFATGFFQDVAAMDANTIRSYSTVVVDGEGKVEEFAFDFNLDGSDAHIAKIQAISAKVAEHVSFTEVDGNATVNVTLPAGMKNTIVSALGEGKGVEAARAKLNGYTVYEAFTLLTFMDSETISKEYAGEINRVVDMVWGNEALINKVLSKVDTASVNVNGIDVDLFAEDATFAIPEDMEGIPALVKAVQDMLGLDIAGVPVINFMNDNGSYTIAIDAGLSIGGIKETVVVNFEIF